jgi:hypothetical protein
MPEGRDRMKFYMRATVLVVMLSFLLVLTPGTFLVHATPPAMDCIRVFLVNGPNAHDYTIHLPNCCQQCCLHDTFPKHLNANQTDFIDLCSNHALTDGYGEFWYHHENETTWTKVGLKRNGEKYGIY